MKNTHLTVLDTRHGAGNVHTTVSDAHYDTPDADNVLRHNVSSTHPIDPEVRGVIANTRTTASDPHRGKLRGHEEVGGQNQAVSITHTLTITE